MAIYLVSPVMPLVVQQLLWAALLIVPAMFLHAHRPAAAAMRPGISRLFKGVGVLALLLGVALHGRRAVGQSRICCSRWPACAAAPRGEARGELPFQPVNSAGRSRRGNPRPPPGEPVMLDF